MDKDTLIKLLILLDIGEIDHIKIIYNDLYTEEKVKFILDKNDEV